MKTRPLGHSGLEVSVLGLGGNTFGPPRIDSVITTQIIRAALDHGINFIDTANGYGRGESERYIAALAGLMDAGKIRAYGASNYASWRLAESAERARASVWPTLPPCRTTTVCSTGVRSTSSRRPASATAWP